jgi:hypothetical protein
VNGFKDLSDDAWYYNYVLKAVELGIVQGYSDGTFRPNANISRAEASKILVKLRAL